jgi:uncharacterized protein YggE
MTDGWGTVLVTGHAMREVPPDRVRLVLSFSSHVHATPRDALAEGAERRRQVSSFLAERHPSATVTDSALRTREESKRVETTRPDGGGSRVETTYERRGFVSTGSVTIEGAVSATAALVASGAAADSASAPRFSLSDELREAVARELDAEAVRDARRKACVLAAADGVAVGRVATIDAVGPAVDSDISYDRIALSDAGPRGSFEEITAGLGEIRAEPIAVASRVVVTFRLAAASGP